MFPLAVAERPIDKCQDQLSDISRVREKRLSFRNFSLITSRHTHTQLMTDRYVPRLSQSG